MELDFEPANPMAQVTSVNQLVDVQPTDWAYQVVRSLVERYGIIAGYLDGRFRGNQPLTRYEFAAVIDATLAELERRFVSNPTLETLREDFRTLQRLQAFYSSAVGEVGDRVSRLDTLVPQLEAQTFSTTTQLQGQTVIALTDGSNARSTIVSRTRLNLITSFTGTDQLVSQLELGNNGSDAINAAQERGQNLFGTNGVLVDGGGLDYGDYSPDVQLSRLYYTFRAGADLAVTIAPRLLPSDFVDRNAFADNSAKNFNSSFFANNPLIVQNPIDRPGGAGAALVWQVGSLPLTLRAVYAAADGANPGNDRGLFGDRRQGIVEAEYAFSKAITARLQYTSGEINGIDLEGVGVNLEWRISPQIGVFGRYGMADYEGFNSVLGQDLDLTPKTWAIGIVALDVVIPGTVAGFAVGQPFVEEALGNATQTNFELFYNLPFTDNISITPSIMLVVNPDNQLQQDIWQWVIRSVFLF